MADIQMDMTEGEPQKSILTFIKPIIVGNVFQQFYSMADTVIVGRCLGVEALAAVGATGTITGLLLGFLMGFTTGLALPCSRFFGAKDIEKLKKGVANAILIAFAVTALGTFFSVAVIGDVLIWVNTPFDIYHMAKEYITVICFGFLCMVAYNMCASMLRAVGNSRIPLRCLLISSGLNIALDFLFILGFGWGVTGAAYATVLSQGMSAVFCIVYIMKKVPILHLARRHMRPDFAVIAIQLKNGIPMALQYSVTALGSVFLQSSLNLLGSTAVAGYTAAVKIECIVTQPYPALGITMASFSAQNKGKGDERRIRAGVKVGFYYCLLYSVAAVILVNLLLPHILLFFVSESVQTVGVYARTFTLIDSIFYFALGCIFLFRETLQGCGHAVFPMIGGIVEMVSRIAFSFMAARHLSFTLVCFANAGTWMAAAVYIMTVYFIMREKLI